MLNIRDPLHFDIGECKRPRHLELHALSRRNLFLVIEALARREQEPKLVSRYASRAGISDEWEPRDLSCAVNYVINSEGWRDFTAMAVLITGEIRTESLLKLQLKRLLGFADLVVVATWTGQIPLRHWLRRTQTRQSHFLLHEVPYDRLTRLTAHMPLMSSIVAQAATFRAGLDRIADVLRASHIPLDVLVLKTRTDVYLPLRTLNHIVSLNYSVPRHRRGKPFMRRLWIPWFEKHQPFYIADDTFAGSLLDLWQLCWPRGALPRESDATLGTAGLQLLWWLLPFLPWYPILHAYRRNAFDITDKMLMGVAELARSKRLPVDVYTYYNHLVALWYSVLATFFHVGGCDDGGVHLLVHRDANISESNDCVYLEKIRPTLGNWGYRIGLSERIVDDSLSKMSSLALNESPMFNATFAKQVVDGDFSISSHSLQISRAAASPDMAPLHFATNRGQSSVQQHGRFAEEIQTSWCWLRHDESPTKDNDDTWLKCCYKSPNNICWLDWPKAYRTLVESACCFPKQSMCPRWLTGQTMMFVASLLELNKSNLNGLLLESNLNSQAVFGFDVFLHFCGEDPKDREHHANNVCKEAKPGNVAYQYSWLCTVRKLWSQIVPGMAEPTSVMQLWGDAPPDAFWPNVQASRNGHL